LSIDGNVGARFTVTSLVEFSYFVLNEMEDGLQVDAFYTDFSEAFDRMNHGLFLGTLTRIFHRPIIFWTCSYLTGRTQRVWVDNYLSETIYCHSGVPQGSLLGPLFFIANINDVLDIFENVRVLVYADDLKLYMRVCVWMDGCSVGVVALLHAGHKTGLMCTTVFFIF
jgi:ribonucleases P/MRP protein subunit RPP40